MGNKGIKTWYYILSFFYLQFTLLRLPQIAENNVCNIIYPMLVIFPALPKLQKGS